MEKKFQRERNILGIIFAVIVLSLVWFTLSMFCNYKSHVTCIKETYNGHDYLFFKQNTMIRGIRGVVHDPDCVKCKAPAKPTKPKPQTGEHQYYIMPTVVETAPSAKK